MQSEHIKVNMIIFRGSNSVIFHFFPVNGGLTLTGKNLLLDEQILSFKIRPSFSKGFAVSRQQNPSKKGDYS